MDATRLAQVRAELEGFLGELTAGLGRADSRRCAATYVRGLLLDGGRKSAGAMAARLAAVDRSDWDYEQGLQQLVAASPWPDRPVSD